MTDAQKELRQKIAALEPLRDGSPLAERSYRELVRRLVFREKDLPYLIGLMSAVDQRDGTRFTFDHIRDPLVEGEVVLDGNRLTCASKSWRWQRYVVDALLGRRRVMFLKGRQIGVTWIALAVDLAECLTIPGSTSLLFRQREDEAIDNMRRWWTLFQSLPPWLVSHIKVSKPDKADRPGRDGVVLKSADGAFSEVVPMTSAASSGHGRSVRRVMVDEAAHVELLLSIRAAIEPAAGRAHIDLISTANGRSNPETGEGNEFHRLWTQAEESGYTRIFLPYDLHPDRDDVWYTTDPEIMSLPLWKRQEQFPRDEHEAFALSDRSFFDPDALLEHSQRVRVPVRRFEWEMTDPAHARPSVSEQGRIRVFQEPLAGHDYALAADVATGRGLDYSAAYVVDLADGELVAEYHARVEADIYARDLHFLGRLYNTALIAIESSGGWGEAVIIALRDGVTGRPRYPRLYRHVMSSRPDKPVAKTFGFPTNTKTRPLILNQLEQHIRERTLPYVGNDLLHEMTEFVHHDSGTSPRARDGSRDDRVLAAAIALEMFRMYGNHPKRPKRKARRGNHVGLGQQQRTPVLVSGIDDDRYKAA